MSQLKGALVFAQSGGPTAVINASACGVFETALKNNKITKVLGAHHGIKGIINDDLFDIGQESEQQISLLKTTPSSALGSVRYKLKDAKEDDRDYLKILEVFKKHNVRYFLYNGGNDSMDTCNKVSSFLSEHGYECNVVGVPKTIDNDLFATDHCPGFASAAKYIATSCMELALDAKVYDKGSILIMEIMGRHAGWLTASSYVAVSKGLGPDLIYVPERDFDIDKFVDDVKRIYDQKGDCIIAVSEGIHDSNGKFINDYAQENAAKDMFNHTQLGGVCSFLAGIVKEKTGAKIRTIEFSLLQRCAAHVASLTDVNEAYLAGADACNAATEGKSGVMVMLQRVSNSPYKCETALYPLSKIANLEKKLPDCYINEQGNNITPAFLDYVLPLIQGESVPPFKNGVPEFATLKKIKAE